MRFYLFMSVFLLFSCETKKEKLCDCLAAGEKLNQFSATLFTGEITAEKKARMDELKADKSKKCLEFRTMSGQEMLKRKAECK